MSISVLVITLNEEKNIQRCMESISWCNDIVVLDSESVDATTKFAESYGARVFVRKFDNYANQRNYGLNKIRYKHDWVLMLDADEVTTRDLVEEMHHAVENADVDVSMYRLRRKDYFMGRWLRFSSGYPTWFGRFVRLGCVTVERAVNEEYHTTGKIGMLDNHLHHYPFNKGFDAWFEKHNRYSTMEAEEKFRTDIIKRQPLKDLLSKDPVIRRKAQKAVIYSLPGRPVLIFLALYVMRRGFLDGKAGLTFSILKAIYEYMIDCKVRELARRENGLPI